MPQSFKNLLAVVLLIVSMGIGMPMMLQGDTNVDLKLTNPVDAAEMSKIYTISSTEIQAQANIRQMVNQGLKPYFLGMGLIFLCVAIAFILMDGEEKLATLKHDEQEKG